MEPEEDDDGDDDPLEDDPDVDATGGARHLSVVLKLLDCRRWVLETKGVSSPHNKVEDNQEGHDLKDQRFFSDSVEDNIRILSSDHCLLL